MESQLRAGGNRWTATRAEYYARRYYVAKWRMNVACRLLRETGGGLTEISSRVGYTDVASFSRAFKALVGQSPSSWRSGKSGT